MEATRVETPLATTTTPMVMIAMMVQSKADPAALREMLAIQREWEANEAAKLFAAALAKFQKDCPQIKKDRGVSLDRSDKSKISYYYASFDDIMKVIGKHLTECGLTVSFSSEVVAGGMLKTTCSLRCGTHVSTNTVTLPVPAQMNVNDTQKMGAAFKYANRYALCAALNITITDDLDDDAASLTSKPITDKQAGILQGMVDALPADTTNKLTADQVRAAFYKWAKVTNVQDIEAKYYDDVHAKLSAKLGGVK